MLKLDEIKKSKSGADIIEIEILQKEAEQVKSYLTKESKNKIMFRLSRFWGRAQKIGVDVIKEILVNVTAEFIKRITIGN